MSRLQELDATHYSAGELVEIANIIASPDEQIYPTAEAKARAIVPAVMRLVAEYGPLHDCGRELFVSVYCPVCDNDE